MKLFIIFCLFIESIQSFNDSIGYKEKGSGGAAQGEYMLQRLTLSVQDINQIFWFDEEKTLLYGDYYGDTLHSWKYDGTIREKYLDVLSGENLMFIIPINGARNKRILASDQNLRIITIDDSNVVVTDPVVVIKEEGYMIHKGHCADDGTLYIILQHCLKIGKPSLLYKVTEEKAELAFTFSSIICDLVFSNNYKQIFVVSNNGQSIERYDLNVDTGELSNGSEVYNLENDELNLEMSSIEIDNENNLWVTTKNSYILTIDSQYVLRKIVQTPFCGLTSITFGGFKMKNILLGTTKTCNMDEMQAGAIMIMTGLNTTGKPPQLVKWST